MKRHPTAENITGWWVPMSLFSLSKAGPRGPSSAALAAFKEDDKPLMSGPPGAQKKPEASFSIAAQCQHALAGTPGGILPHLCCIL